MAYATMNFPTKKALKEHVTHLNELNKRKAEGDKEYLSWYQPGPFGQGEQFLLPGQDTVLEGPHFPKPHSWYAQVVNKEGVMKVS